jgi:hypothetical protein
MTVASSLVISTHNRMEINMTEKKNWKLQPGVSLAPEVADEVAKVACALKSLSAYTTFAMEREDCPEDLRKIVDDGLEAMARIFQW